jgi:hypothetical protein
VNLTAQLNDLPMIISKKNLKISAIAATVLVSASFIFTSQIPANAANAPAKFSLALTGDMPYDALGVTQTPNVIAEINANPRIDFTLFSGDTMSGKGDKCTDAAYPALRTNFFDKFTRPIFYTIGDNEWVDCDRAVKGGYDPLTRLALVRSNFFQDATGAYISLGGKFKGTTPKVLHDAVYPELQMFSYKGITFIIPHVPGSANNSAVTSPAFKTYNDTAVDGNDAEYKARDAANVAWIAKGFAKAKADDSVGVIILVQADMDWEGFARNQASPNNENTAAFAATKQAILTGTLAFAKPVLLQNGDQHWFQVDMPMNETAGKLVELDKGTLVENFTRVQTFGSAFNHWVELTIDPRSDSLWTFTPRIVKANIGKH